MGEEEDEERPQKISFSNIDGVSPISAQESPPNTLVSPPVDERHRTPRADAQMSHRDPL